ncbi:MAG: tyrosine-type recombinase/integrase [Candidatus Nanoarchaeia archaeon]|nr:tyrosine-type recombinase/integrase [Candidatus Nanoarchaeia archaeon]
MDKKEVCRKIKTELQIQGKSIQTQKTYCYFNERFLDFVNKDVKDIDEDDVKSFLASLLSEKKYDLSSVALARSSLKYFYDDLLKKNILVNIKTPKKQRKLPDVLTKDEVKLLIENSGSLRNKLLIEFMYSSGLRVSECAKLKIDDLNLEEKTGLLKLGKGGKDRFFILSEKVIEDFKKYLETEGKIEYVFPGTNGAVGVRAIQRVVTRIAKKSGIKKHVYCHLLRHAFATHLLEDGVDIRKIQLLLNHANLQTTSWYTQVSTKELKKVKSPLDSL